MWTQSLWLWGKTRRWFRTLGMELQAFRFRFDLPDSPLLTLQAFISSRDNLCLVSWEETSDRKSISQLRCAKVRPTNLWQVSECQLNWLQEINLIFPSSKLGRNKSFVIVTIISKTSRTKFSILFFSIRFCSYLFGRKARLIRKAAEQWFDMKSNCQIIFPSLSEFTAAVQSRKHSKGSWDLSRIYKIYKLHSELKDRLLFS